MTDKFRDDFDLGETRSTPPAKAEPSRESWGLFADVDPAEYHADPCPEPSLSNSLMGYLLDETPQDFAFRHPRLNLDREELDATVQQIRGQVVHRLALGKGSDYAVGDFDDWRTAAAKAFKSEALAEGLYPIKAADFEKAQILADIARKRISAALDGAHYETEVAFYYQEETEAGPIWCRGMVDVWSPETATILDLKITPQLYDAMIARQMLNMGWDRQAAFYPHAIGMIKPELAGRVRFADLMIKPEAPYTARLAAPEKAWIASSLRQAQRAMQIFGACLYAGRWPGFGKSVDLIKMPGWEDKRREAIELAS